MLASVRDRLQALDDKQDDLTIEKARAALAYTVHGAFLPSMIFTDISRVSLKSFKKPMMRSMKQN